MAVDVDTLRRVPKVALHDHLDGGLRPTTMLEIAEQIGHRLPASEPQALGDWFFEAADSGSLPRYLETFDHTTAVMQRREDLARVAREFVVDQASDGVVYAEARWAPEQHLKAGLSMPEAVEAVHAGLVEGMTACAERGQDITARQILCGMRHADNTEAVARLALAYRDETVAGFDIAGAEVGFPATDHRAAFDVIRTGNGRITIHAGEAAGPESVQDAVLCGAHRLGHGVRILEDVDAEGRLGTLAAYVRDLQIPLEVCPTSNLQTGTSESYATHQFGRLRELGFTLTVSCDNRLMGRTTLSEELAHLAEAFDLDLDDIELLTLNAAYAAFLPLDERERIIEEQILPGFESLR